MNTSLKWIKDLVPGLDCTPQEYMDAMTLSGSKVEGYENMDEDLDKIVIGQVKSIEKHPDADKLVICQVDIGTETIQIVTGAPNVTEGCKVPVVLDGGKVAGGHDGSKTEGGIKIKKGKLRGVESNGMMCSIEELGSNRDMFPLAPENGLYILPEDAPVGESAISYLGLDDTVVEYEITSNRVDCFSILGIAREAAATFGKEFVPPVVTETGNNEDVNDYIKVSVKDDKLCSRYTARVVKNIRIAPSPEWMQCRLRAQGIRPINNIVDITNYVMLEIGQPMHAFDMNTLESSQIIVRRAKQDEMIQTLDGKEFKLNENNLVICDGSKPVALAGIMGGMNSEITENTTQLLFESAKFMRDNIRKTARSLGQNTDASSHYEKGIAEYTVEIGMARALHLIEELGCGEITASAFDVSAGAPREGKKFTATLSGINKILGIEVPAENVLDILRRLCFEVERDGDVLTVTAPRYREDIEVGEPDLAEEVIREYGYEHIVPTFLKDSAVTNGGLNPAQKRRTKLKQVMVSQGYYEVSTLAFYSDADLDALHITADAKERNVIRLLNPITTNLSIMRTTLAPSMLNTVVENVKKGNTAGRFFEYANVYYPKALPLTELPNEIPHVGFAAFGEQEDFFTVKGTMEELAASFGVSFEYERAEDVPYLHPGISAYVLCDGERVGSFGKLANSVAGELKLPKDSKANNQIYIGEIDFAALSAHMPEGLRYKPISEYDTVTRDLAMVVDEETSCGSLIDEIKKACKQVGDVELFDIYRGDQIGKGKKSMAFKISFIPEDKALDPTDVERFVKKILGNLKFRLGADIR